ncbi:hypothetical protein [Nocardia vermiculata]|uniref:Uncharacterized protein n=1 Tax=Nocardia vermiculata TaxID=257274 RepID=A0A846Y3N4_9NOCA|nr:hypothetical protein [Nocardia vermiculata]NKY52865.1 hypothetical protein [Nocardia vermiculata]
MTAVTPLECPAPRISQTVEVAGVPWPVYKLEALALGVLVGLVLGVVFGSAQLAVLAAAGVAALRWTAGAVTRSVVRARATEPVDRACVNH